MDAAANRVTGSSAVCETANARKLMTRPVGNCAPAVQSGAHSMSSLSRDTSIVTANAGDHARVLSLLIQQQQLPLADDFQSRLDEPGYEPANRLLLNHRGQLVGQVQLVPQTAWFEHERVPINSLRDLAVLEEFQLAGHLGPLLNAAEKAALADRAILAVTRTHAQDAFLARGWSVCRGQGYTQVNTRSLLAHVMGQSAQRIHRQSAIEVRPWKHFELDAIEPLYQQVAEAKWGALHRSEEQWRWLVGRKVHDQILIAVKRHGGTVDGTDPKIVGYAVIRDSHIFEMATLPGFATVRALLLARACREALDRDHHCVALHSCPTDPLHEVLVTAGGTWVSEGTQGGTPWMFKLLSHERWVEKLYPVLCCRARDAGLLRPLELRIAVGMRHYRLLFTRRSIRLEQEVTSGSANVICDASTFQDLLLGNLAISDSVKRGNLEIHDSAICEMLTALFPPRFFWQSPFELLQL